MDILVHKMIKPKEKKNLVISSIDNFHLFY